MFLGRMALQRKILSEIIADSLRQDNVDAVSWSLCQRLATNLPYYMIIMLKSSKCLTNIESLYFAHIQAD